MRSHHAANGHAAAALPVTGTSHAGPSAMAKVFKGSESGRDEDVVRLMIQALGDMGYTKAVQCLSEESGVTVESALVEDFRRAILGGAWTSAEAAVTELELSDPTSAHVGTSTAMPDDPLAADVAKQVLFLIREQKFLECLENGRPSEALVTLRTELSPLKHNIDRLHFLSSLIMTGSPEDLRARADWSGVSGDSRTSLLRRLSSYISPNSMIPEARLATLLDSARDLLVENCPYHTSSAPISLLIPDHRCPRSVFPSQTSHVLREHSDEVWHVQFSPNGRYLASTGADGLIVIYDATTMRPLHLLNRRTAEEVRADSKDGRLRGVSYMSFNSDESTLMTCSQDNVIVHWDVVTGQIINQISNAHDSEPVSSASWLPTPNTGFVSGGLDKKINLYDDKGGVIHSWDTARIYDIKVSLDGKYMVAISTESGVYLFNLETRALVAFLVLDFELTSVTLSKDSKRMLLSCSPLVPKGRSSTPRSQAMEVQEWSFPEMQLLRKVKGQKQGEFVIRSCYAGYAEQFIMSGSEDSDVYLWHRKSGSLLERISGHTKSVGAVSWNPAKDQWASASDDKTVRIWDVERARDVRVEDDMAARSSNSMLPTVYPSTTTTTPHAYWNGILSLPSDRDSTTD